jgi:hypothetical protein
MRGDGACGGQGSAQSPSPNQSPISAARTYESDPGADLRDRVQGRVRFSLDPGVRVQGRVRFALDPRVRVQGRVRFALDRGVRFQEGVRDLLWTGESESKNGSDLARHLLRLGFVWSVAVAEKGVVLMDGAPDLTSLAI